MLPIHDRTPVILMPSNYAHWLDVAHFDRAKLASLLRPYPPEDEQRGDDLRGSIGDLHTGSVGSFRGPFKVFSLTLRYFANDSCPITTLADGVLSDERPVAFLLMLSPERAF